MAWTLYGLIVSQYKDVHDRLENGEEVAQFLKSYFGYRKGFLALVAVVVPAFAIAFAVVFALTIKLLNFQRR